MAQSAKKTFEIPCGSEAEARKTAKQINDVSMGSVTATAVQKSDGSWVVRVVEN